VIRFNHLEDLFIQSNLQLYVARFKKRKKKKKQC